MYRMKNSVPCCLPLFLLLLIADAFFSRLNIPRQYLEISFNNFLRRLTLTLVWNKTKLVMENVCENIHIKAGAVRAVQVFNVNFY